MNPTKKFGEEIIKDVYGNGIYAKTEGQLRLVEAIDSSLITLVSGCAGSGKSFISAAMAAKYLKEGKAEKIILTRPLITTEKIGYLPGTLEEKVYYFMLPLFSIFNQFFKQDEVRKPNLEQIGKNKVAKKRKVKNSTPEQLFSFNYLNNIEVRPIAFMRGATYGSENDKATIIIVDEAENLTKHQCKMILTRLGDHPDSKLILNGDTSQSDLPFDQRNGLEDAIERLKGVNGISMVTLTESDIVRNKIIIDILRRYENTNK